MPVLCDHFRTRGGIIIYKNTLPLGATAPSFAGKILKTSWETRGDRESLCCFILSTWSWERRLRESLLSFWGGLGEHGSSKGEKEKEPHIGILIQTSSE